MSDKIGLSFEYHSSENCPEFDSYEISKSFIGLALALLQDEGKIPCFDVPVHHYFPLWNKKGYNEITIRHLLNNTSGLAPNVPLPMECTDTLEALLRAPIFFKPGTRYQRNERALVLLLEIIKKESGKEFGNYLEGKLLGPLGVEVVSWRALENGSCIPNLVISAADLAKVGVLIANKGMWGNQRLLSERAYKEMFSPSQCFDPFFGLQWWMEFHDIAVWWDESLLKAYECAGISYEIVERLRGLSGRVVHIGGLVCGTSVKRVWGTELCQIFGSKAMLDYFVKEVRCHSLPFGRFKTGSVKAISARGKGGQQLVVLPQHQLVGVRQKAIRHTFDSVDDFEDFTVLLEALAKECDCYID